MQGIVFIYVNILTAPVILRRMKKQVCKELPPKTEVTLYCGFSKEQRIGYDDILNAGKRKLKDCQESSVFQMPGFPKKNFWNWFIKFGQTDFFFFGTEPGS